MRKVLVSIIASAVVVTMLSAFGTLTAFATPQPGGCTSVTCPNSTPGLEKQGKTTGQPGAPTNTCGSPGTSPPGNSANAAGSPFGSGVPPGGSANGGAANNYAGNPGTASLQHSNSGASIAQYDSACFH